MPHNQVSVCSQFVVQICGAKFALASVSIKAKIQVCLPSVRERCFERSTFFEYWEF